MNGCFERSDARHSVSLSGKITVVFWILGVSSNDPIQGYESVK